MGRNSRVSIKGQSTVEYIMLMAVLVILSVSILTSQRFQEFLGFNGNFFEFYSRYMETTYRHGHIDQGNPADDYEGYSGRHGSYATPDDTRFFTIRERYGTN